MPETSAAPPADVVHHPAVTVGSTFMRQYYHLLAKEPASLHRFYKDESTWCHGVGSHMQEAISGQRAINDEILRRGYAGARVDLDIGSIDCQPSLDGGVFVLVTGVMTLASSPLPKPFVQTFFLAVQPKGYFVLNDCLRFLELPAAADAAVAPKDAKKQPAQAAIGTPVAAASPAAKAATKPVTPVTKKDKAAPTPASPAKAAKPAAETPVSPIKVKSPVKVASPKAAPASAPAAPASPVKKASAPAAEAKTAPKPSETKAATPASPAAKTAKAAASAPAAAAPAAPASPAVPKPAAPATPVVPAAPAAPPAPKTWAALFSGAPAAPVAAPKLAAVTAAATAAAKPTPASPAKAQADVAPAKPTESAAAPAAAAAPQEKEKKRLYSLYIRDVPPQTKEGDLRELFKAYGTIASVGVPAGRGIAFVDYREEESMRAALADDKEFKVHDKVLHVEERKDKEQRSNFRADSRGGRGGRGAPKSGRSGDRKDREDGKERRPADGANGKPAGDRREKGGRRSGKEDGGRGNSARAE